MKVLHLASGNRWTGAAAPAFAEVEALRAAGIDAHYAYVGGYKLQAKIGHLDFTHPLIEKAQNPLSFRRTVVAIDRIVGLHRFDVIHAHLTWDHWLARFVARNHVDLRLARTFHSRRALRNDPLTRSLVRRTRHLFIANETFGAAALLQGRDAAFTPPPLDRVQFSPDGDDARALYGIENGTKVVTVIGKLSKGRGFEDALRTFALLRRAVPARMMIIGHGEHRPALEQLARSLAIDEHITWAGYHEDDLAGHYRASDVLLFTARGSDEGHRAILEAMACGIPVAAYPLEGVAALVPSAMIAAAVQPEALAATAATLLDGDLRRAVREHTFEFGYEKAAERLARAYAQGGEQRGA